jgi:hypothetical protein
MPTPREIARQEWANAQPFYRGAVTRLQAQAQGRDIPEWPGPCEICGALYRLTPKGRWMIDHFPHEQMGPLPDLNPPRRPYVDD